jgi:hypothetical protein
MAWTDDRLWCHPKYVGLSWRAKAVLRHSFEYAGGMGTRGTLSEAAQTVIGATPTVRNELIEHGWWEVNGDGASVHIHDWEEHNGRRLEKRAKDRERLRRWRENQR